MTDCCANCDNPRKFTRTVKYAFEKNAFEKNFIDIEWFFCSEKCYNEWIEKQIKKGTVPPKIWRIA